MIKRHSLFLCSVLAVCLFLCLLVHPNDAAPATPAMINRLLSFTTPSKEHWGCVNFSPYVQGYNPDMGPHPPPSLIDELLDVLVTQTNFKCIQTYGVLNNLIYIFEAAQKRGLKVVAVIWLTPNAKSDNNQSISLGIETAKKYVDTIIGLSCGSEMRVRNTVDIASPPVVDCIQKLKAANVEQPVTSNDYYWFWCDQQSPCKQWSAIADLVDYVAINAFPWWENKNSPQCVSAENAPQSQLDMFREVNSTYSKPVIISEYGWPGGPKGYKEVNRYTNESCSGEASEENQTFVLEESMKLLMATHTPGILFSAFRETWKEGQEGAMASYWGMCNTTAPYNCKSLQGWTPKPRPRDSNGGVVGDSTTSASSTTTVYHLSMSFVILLCATIIHSTSRY